MATISKYEGAQINETNATGLQTVGHALTIDSGWREGPDKAPGCVKRFA